MDFDELKNIAKGFGVKVGFGNKGLYASLAQIMPDNEQVLFILEGIDKKSAGKVPLIVTGKALYTISYAGMFGTNTAVIPIPKITSVYAESGGFGGLLQNLCVAEGTVVHVIANVAVAQQAISVISRAQSMVSAQAPTTAAPVSQADELAKFKKLLDDGALTQDEFDRKKAQILGL